MYPKPHLTFSEQVNRLQERGLTVNNIVEAQAVLASTNYYRFTGYALPFMEGREKFKAGVAFEHVVQAMRLDEKLRDLLAVALEGIEIDFRTTLAYEHSLCYGAMGYANRCHFTDAQKHDEMLAKVNEAIKKAKNDEKCVSHLIRKYGEIPVWAMVEVVSFGAMVRMYRNLHKPDQIRIAKRYAIRHDILASYLQHISVVRNICAHHARLWDKTFYGVRPLNKWRERKLPVSDTQHLFYTLLLVHHLTHQLPSVLFDRAAWKQELIKLLKDFDALPNCNASKIMGIPANGFEDVWWE